MLHLTFGRQRKWCRRDRSGAVGAAGVGTVGTAASLEALAALVLSDSAAAEATMSPSPSMFLSAATSVEVSGAVSLAPPPSVISHTTDNPPTKSSMASPMPASPKMVIPGRDAAPDLAPLGPSAPATTGALP